MILAFHIVIVVLFTAQACLSFYKCDTGTEFCAFLVQLFLAVWAWLHLFKVW